MSRTEDSDVASIEIEATKPAVALGRVWMFDALALAAAFVGAALSSAVTILLHLS
jgi:hypothetical protein